MSSRLLQELAKVLQLLSQGHTAHLIFTICQNFVQETSLCYDRDKL